MKHLQDIKKFKQKYFGGCTDDFVKLGFKARLYRTWISILTQFHFLYLWNSLFREKVYASAEMDMEGIDGRVIVDNNIFDLQVKKISYRKEVGIRRFTRGKRGNTYIFEILYIVYDPKELNRKYMRARESESRERYRIMMEFFNRYLLRFENGFIVFKKEYAQRVYELMRNKLGNYVFRDIFDLKKLF